jgi:hypothetical protein
MTLDQVTNDPTVQGIVAQRNEAILQCIGITRTLVPLAIQFIQRHVAAASMLNTRGMTQTQQQQHEQSLTFLNNFRVDNNHLSRLCFIIVAAFRSELLEEHLSFHTTSLTFTTGLYLLSIQTTIYNYNPTPNVPPNKDPITRSLNKILIITIANCCFNYTLNITLTTLQEQLGLLLLLDENGNVTQHSNQPQRLAILNLDPPPASSPMIAISSENLVHRTISLICRAICKITKHFHQKHGALLLQHNQQGGGSNDQFHSQYIQYSSIFPILIEIYRMIQPVHVPFITLDRASGLYRQQIERNGEGGNNNQAPPQQDRLYQSFRDLYSCFPSNDTRNQCLDDLEQYSEPPPQQQEPLGLSVRNFWQLYQTSPQVIDAIVDGGR